MLPLCVEVYIRPVLPLCSGTLRTFVRKVPEAIDPKTRKMTKFTGKPETPKSESPESPKQTKIKKKSPKPTEEPKARKRTNFTGEPRTESQEADARC